ncbi:peamaclein-like [Zingiber officinale]|uniref:peamaclein-like n=1 Tax=Zingiber officinale TaxID=94328 RepID=UPI001C4B282C|nr:peamaclein-like [Zingiber officinale]
MLHFTMKLFSATTVFLLLLLASSFLQAAMAGSAFCEGKCKVRCAKAGMMDRCLNYCGMCCEDCKCVPSGTYGNKDECPCYRDKVAKNNKNSKNNQNKPKCP